MSLAPAISSASVPRIIWHFGFQKTGTTAAQWLMRKNQALLQDKVAIFPRGRWTAALRGAAGGYLTQKTQAAKIALQDEVRQIVQAVHASGQPAAVVSDENVLGLRVQDETGDIFAHAETILPVIEQAAGAGCEFHFLTRDPESWLKSAHNQEVKQLRCRQDYASWRAAQTLVVNWSDLRDRLAATVSGAVMFHDMDDDRKAGQPTGACLLQAAGVDAATIARLKTPGRKNQGLSDSALAFMLQINQSDLKYRQVGRVRDVVVANMGLFK